jgi:EamA domain-containing membrane protein RarD
MRGGERFMFHVSPFHKEEVIMKRAIVSFIFAVTLIFVFSYQAESSQRIVLGEFFTNTG